jgi:hypothetical protein
MRSGGRRVEIGSRTRVAPKATVKTLLWREAGLKAVDRVPEPVVFRRVSPRPWFCGNIGGSTPQAQALILRKPDRECRRF